MRGLLVLLACTGCSSILGIDNFKLGDASPPGDGDPDGPPIDVPAGCLGPQRFAVCLQPPTTAFTYNATSPAVDTGVQGTLCLTTQPMGWTAQGQPDACFIVGSSVTINASMRVTGPRPLVIVSDSSIDMMQGAGIDAAAHLNQGTLVPPGVPSTDCMQPQPPQEIGGQQGDGGGAGGTFLTRGGDGGQGAGGLAQGGIAGPGGAAPTKLRAGCNGGFGGRGQQAAQPPGGFAGGAVYLVAKTRINLAGLINVSGAPGVPGGPHSGGSGGGSGGMVVLYAPQITGNGAVVMANGGGGAGGSSNTIGTPGREPDPTNPTAPAPGGGGAGAPGGSGFAGPVQAAAGGVGNFQTGGGGGGGGGGYIRINMQNPAIVFSPAPDIQ